MATTTAFDQFSRALASRSEPANKHFAAAHSSRRGVLRALAGLTLGGVLRVNTATIDAAEKKKTCKSQNRACKRAVYNYCSQFTNAITCWNNVVPCCQLAKACKRGKALRCLRRRA
jgi:hypothetical protein